MLLIITSALLLILAFPNFNLNYSAFIGFVPLFLALQNRSYKNAFLVSFFCGLLFYLGVLYWLYHVTVIGLIALCLYLAIYFGIFGCCIINLSRACERSRFLTSIQWLVLIPAIWTILEYLQSNLFSGFGWTLLGYSQYKNLSFIQIADFSGVYGVSFVILMTNGAIYRLFRRSYKEIIIAGLVITAVVIYGRIRLKEPERDYMTVKISLIQGNIPQEIKWNPDVSEAILDKYILLTKMASLDAPDLIIWPETAFPGFFIRDKNLTEKVVHLVSGINTSLLLGTNVEERGNDFNSTILISKGGKIAGRYDKIHLVPFGEYVPFSDRFPILHRLILGELGEFTAGQDYKVFLLPLYGGLNIRFSVLICFEDIFPELAKKFVLKGADFLVVITNDAWYGRSGAPYQHVACSVFRAIENHVPVVRCANTGYSCFIDSKGRIYDPVRQNNRYLFITGYKTSSIKLPIP